MQVARYTFGLHSVNAVSQIRSLNLEECIWLILLPDLQLWPNVARCSKCHQQLHRIQQSLPSWYSKQKEPLLTKLIFKLIFIQNTSYILINCISFSINYFQCCISSPMSLCFRYACHWSHYNRKSKLRAQGKKDKVTICPKSATFSKFTGLQTDYCSFGNKAQCHFIVWPNKGWYKYDTSKLSIIKSTSMSTQNLCINQGNVFRVMTNIASWICLKPG